MSSGILKKKRLSLQDVVDKLTLGVLDKVSEVVELNEVRAVIIKDRAKQRSAPPKHNCSVYQKVKLPDEIPGIHEEDQERRHARSHRIHLAKTFAAPSSPGASESSADDIPVSDKEVVNEELPKESGPVEPMRCGVCGFRVYKSYRYISRSSAPIHLKIFFDPDTERFRVCKRCFSSKERCRQNLALLLLKSQTEQNVLLRSELGITQGRRTEAMKYLFRDIGRSLKRPYEDLICDETFDDDYLSDGDESIPIKTVKKEPVSTKTFNDGEKLVGTGVVTVVRPSSNAYRNFPNHFTIYGELGQSRPFESEVKPDENKDMTMIKMNNKKTEEKTLENRKENGLPDANGELKSEIKTINYKLTLLDHAYALPAAKTVKPCSRPPKSVPEVNKNDSLAKAAIKNMIKNNGLVKKTASSSSSSTENKAVQPTRTCGIICSICKNLVTKSYSCYRKDNAPEKIRSYFNGDVKVMKVCRRCVPYKKPKGDVQPSKVTKNKVKILQAKILKQKVTKQMKKASKSEVKSTKSEISTQTKDKISQKLLSKIESKTKSVEKEGDLKKDDLSIVHVSPKKDTTVVHVSITNGKVDSTSNSVIKTIFPPIGNSTEMKNDSMKAKSTSPRMGQMVEVKNPLDSKLRPSDIGQSQTTNVMYLKLKTPFVGKAPDKEKTDGDHSNSSVDFGTQPMQSMIGLKKAKAKPIKKIAIDEEIEKKFERKNADKKATENEKDKDNSAQVKSDNEAAKEKENPTKETDCKEYKVKINTELPGTDNRTEKETVRKLNVESSNSNSEGKVSRPTSSKPLIEPIRSSPRRDKNVIQPDKTRKEVAESKNQATKKKKEFESDTESAKQHDEKATTKHIVENTSEKQNEEKPNEKGDLAGKRSTRKGREKVASSHSYSTRWAQSPVKCGCCHENVVKSYRCVRLGASPTHLKPVFMKEGKTNLRICRKCLNFPSRVKSFL